MVARRRSGEVSYISATSPLGATYQRKQQLGGKNPPFTHTY